VSTPKVVKLRAVVLRTIRYGDKGIVLRCYTDTQGLQGYMLSGVSGKRSTIKPAMLFPLTELELVTTSYSSSSLGRIREARLVQQSPATAGVGWEGALSSFGAELFSGLVKEDSPNPRLFSWFCSQISMLHQPETPQQLAYFPLFFVLGLIRELGFFPSDNPGVYFNLAEGRFCDLLPEHAYILNGAMAADFRNLIQAYHVQIAPKMPRERRAELLESLLLFCKLHHEPRLQVRSIDILRELM
jgi:DNA repair protein RecO (recombination protein O)